MSVQNFDLNPTLFHQHLIGYRAALQQIFNFEDLLFFTMKYLCFAKYPAIDCMIFKEDCFGEPNLKGWLGDKEKKDCLLFEELQDYFVPNFIDHQTELVILNSEAMDNFAEKALLATQENYFLAFNTQPLENDNLETVFILYQTQPILSHELLYRSCAVQNHFNVRIGELLSFEA